jgi:hypothetical protein
MLGAGGAARAALAVPAITTVHGVPVDSDALVARRQHVLNEILTSENNYVTTLYEVVQVGKTQGGHQRCSLMRLAGLPHSVEVRVR